MGGRRTNLQCHCPDENNKSAMVVDDTTFYPDRKSHYVPGGLGRDHTKFW